MISRNTIEAAADRCVQLEQRDGCEHAVVLNSDGNVLFEHGGGEHSIDFSKYSENGMMNTAHTVVHNHPINEDNPSGGGSLSIQDLMFAKAHGVEIWAVGSNGNRYWSKGFYKDIKNGMAWMLTSMEYEQLMNTISTDLLNHIRRTAKTQKELKEGELEFFEIAGHLTNLVARKSGMIDYHWELCDSTQAIFDKYLPFINQRCGADSDIYTINKNTESRKRQVAPDDLLDLLMAPDDLIDLMMGIF